MLLKVIIALLFIISIWIFLSAPYTGTKANNVNNVNKDPYYDPSNPNNPNNPNKNTDAYPSNKNETEDNENVRAIPMPNNTRWADLSYQVPSFYIPKGW